MTQLFKNCVQGDARQAVAYEAALGGRKADLLLTDPPYCLLTRRRKGGDLRDPKGRKIDRDPVLRFENVREYRAFTEAWLSKAAPHLNTNATWVIWTNFLGKEPIVSEASRHGYTHLWGEFVWAKRGTDKSGNEQLLRVYEVALVLSKKPAPKEDPASQPRVWSYVSGYDDEGEGKDWGDHPHHKPFGVVDALVRTYSQPGQLVLDPFAGSGSIPSAALKLQRSVAGIESKHDWAALVTKRLASQAPSRDETNP